MRLIKLAGALALAVSLSGCLGAGGLPGAGVGGSPLEPLKAILTDPNCGHHDEIEVITGAAGIPGSFHAKAVRDCPAPVPRSAPPPAANASPIPPYLGVISTVPQSSAAIGQIVAPPPP